MAFRINRVYTRSGDSGDTGLVGGRRVRKTDARVEAYGDVDELNSFLGLLKEELTPGTAALRELIEYIQQELFDLGSELATPPEDEYPEMWHAAAEHIAALEALCDRYGDALPELTSFILPGGSRVASLLHIGRTIARRAERRTVQLADELAGEGKTFNQDIVRYLNRLSDLLFVLARWSLAADNKEAPLWQPARDRKLPK